MIGALDQLRKDEQSLFREIVGREDSALLMSLEKSSSPTHAERRRVMEILWDEFDRHVSGPDWEPSELGKRVDNLLGSFLLHYPVSA